MGDPRTAEFDEGELSCLKKNWIKYKVKRR